MGISNSRVLEIYGAFLNDIAHKEAEAKRIVEKIELLNKSEFSNRNNSKQDFREDEEPDAKRPAMENCVIICSGNQGNLGEIISVSNEVMNFFGYKAREVIGQNIEILMPKYYGERHDQFMRNYF